MFSPQPDSLDLEIELLRFRAIERSRVIEDSNYRGIERSRVIEDLNLSRYRTFLSYRGFQLSRFRGIGILLLRFISFVRKFLLPLD